MRTDLGAMNRRVKIQQPSGTSGYTDVDEVPGALGLLAAATIETMQGGALTAQTHWQWMVQYRTDLKAEWRLQDAEDGRVFQIHGFGDPDSRQRRLVIFCTEIQ
jgi:head-tail adaptor